MKQSQLKQILNNFNEYESIDIKTLLDIDSDILDIIISADINHKELLVSLYQERKLRNHNAYKNINEEKDIEKARIIKDLYAIDFKEKAKFKKDIHQIDYKEITDNDYDKLANIIKNCNSIVDAELSFRIISDIYRLSIFPLDNIHTFIDAIKDTTTIQKKEILTQFLCESEILVSYSSINICRLFSQLQYAYDDTRCSDIYNYILDETKNKTDINKIIDNLSFVDVDETSIDVNNENDLKKLLNILEKTDTEVIDSKKDKVLGKGKKYKIKLK